MGPEQSSGLFLLGELVELVLVNRAVYASYLEVNSLCVSVAGI